jgi:hypothetical protein
MEANVELKAAAEKAHAVNEAIKAQAPDQRTTMPDTDGEAKGWALAESVIAQCKEHGQTWLFYVAKLAKSSVDTRNAFLKHINKHVRDMGLHVKATSATGDIKDADPVFRGAKSSAIVRMSEFTKIVKALNAGYMPSLKMDENKQDVPFVNPRGDWVIAIPFATVVAEARLFLNSDAASGKGRPKKPFLDKLKKFLEDNCEEMEQYKAAYEFIGARIQTKGNSGKATDAPF